MAERVRAIKESGAKLHGDILITVHGMHEAPWAYGETLCRRIDKGYMGDAVIVMEGPTHELAVIAKGAGIFEIDMTQERAFVHQGLAGGVVGIAAPIVAGTRLVQAFTDRNVDLAQMDLPYVGPEVYFVGILRSGDLYNRTPTHCHLEGTWRYGPDHTYAEVEAKFHAIVKRVAAETGADIRAKMTCDRGAFRIDPETPVAVALQAAYAQVYDRPLPLGGMMACADAAPFVEAGVPATYHGPHDESAHADIEYAVLESLVNAAKVYLLAALQHVGLDTA